MSEYNLSTPLGAKFLNLTNSACKCLFLVILVEHTIPHAEHQISCQYATYYIVGKQWTDQVGCSEFNQQQPPSIPGQ